MVSTQIAAIQPINETLSDRHNINQKKNRFQPAINNDEKLVFVSFFFPMTYQ